MSNRKILVTGGCGYIGSHTIVELINSGYEVLCLDDNSRSDETLLGGIEKITGKRVKNNKIDLKRLDLLDGFFAEHNDVDSVIHFAAYKYVGESVKEPFMYYENNLNGMNNLLRMCQKYNVKNFIFSSSCTVYGRSSKPPVNEEATFGEAESTYGRTKQICEYMLMDYHKILDTKIIPLRYFNPVGAHESGLIGNVSYTKPESLAPFITQVAAGKLEKLTVFGGDYNTKDGTAVRDYIHVSDIANAHVLALKHLDSVSQSQEGAFYDVFNLGTGTGSTVLEVITAFEEANGIKIPYEVGYRREGDLEAMYADNKKAIDTLRWEIKYDLKMMMKTEWEWGRGFYL